MTQTQLDCQLARITGESRSTLRLIGFSIVSRQPEDLLPEDLRLVLDCPFCGQPVPYPGDASDGSEMAECDRCDVYFGFDPDEVYTIGTDERSAGRDHDRCLVTSSC